MRSLQTAAVAAALERQYPADERILSMKGSIHERLGNSRLARDAWQEVLSINPYNLTVIEALRAFDIVYIVNRGRNGLELLSVLVTDNIIGEASRIGYGSAIAVILIGVSIIPIVVFVWNSFQESEV